jgi:type I restriction enzyme S subunit
MKRLKYLTTINPPLPREHVPRPDDEVSFLPMERIGDDGSLELSELRAARDVSKGYTAILDGDVVIAKITPCFENGKGALCQGLHGGIAFGTTELIVLRAKPSSDRRFLYWLTRSYEFRKWGEAEMRGSAGQKRVSEEFVSNFRAAELKSAEQRRIAEHLDEQTGKIDRLIALRQQQIELLEEQRAALIQQAVTRGLNPSSPLKDSALPWLGHVPAHWEVMQLRRLIDPTTSITYGIVQAGPHVEGGIPYIRTSDMSGDTLPLDGYLCTTPEIDRSYQRSKVRAGDVVVAIRATIGQALPVPPELDGANLTQGTAKISPEQRVTPSFLLAALRSETARQQFRSLAKGTTFLEITLDMLRRITIPLPSVEEQKEIVAFIERGTAKIDTLRSAYAGQLRLLAEYRTALIHEAVTGQRRAGYADPLGAVA